MEQYDFTLKFALGQHDADPDAFIDRLLIEGCDDALIGIGQRGRIALDFTREASSADDAILTAISDVRRAIPDAIFIEATPDLVGLTDIAILVGVSRQYMRKLVMASGPKFPLPVHAGKRPIWHLETVLTWFAKNQSRKMDEVLLETSRITRLCNHVKEQARIDKEQGRMDRDLSEHFKKALAA